MNTKRPHPDALSQDPTDAQVRTVLMHAVLDGTADARQVSALNALLASDAEAAEEFATWKAMFRAMAAMPMAHPPEGLVASISKAVAAESLPARKELSSPNQLSFVSSVLASGQARRFRRDLRNFFHRPGRSESSQEFGQMNASRKIWAGSALAAVALGIVVFASGYPPKAEDLTGTVAPAERYRAPQAGGDAIKLSEPSGSATAVPALTTAGIEAAQADASRTMQKSDAQLQAEKADASRIAQKSDAQLQAEKADASRIAQKNDAQRQAGKADASRIAQKTDAQLQAEKTEASKATAERALN